MKYAVTAANGKLGSSIVSSLVQQIDKENVVGIVRSPDKATHLGIEIRKGDYNSYEDFNAALKGIEKLLLVSGRDDPQRRLQQHINVIRAAKQNGVKKIVYTSIVGDERETAFSPIVESNRQTEMDIMESGLNWVIGRNGIYIEPDLEYIDTYIKEGEIRNCAADGRCGYTSRDELALAYTEMMLDNKHNSKIYNLTGEPITQFELTELINKQFNIDLNYNSISVEKYEAERQAELGDFLGTVVAGIYHAIRIGAYEVSSHFENVVGRPHKSAEEMIKSYKKTVF